MKAEEMPPMTDSSNDEDDPKQEESDESDDEDEVFGEGRKVEEKSESEYVEQEVEKKEVKREVIENDEGKITIKRERLDSAEYIQARRVGNFINNQLKVKDSIDEKLEGEEAKVKLEQSEEAPSDASTTNGPTYESEPADGKGWEYRNAKKRTRSDDDEEWRKRGIKPRIVELSDAQFEELMLQELENRKQVKKRISRKINLKRLKSNNKRKVKRNLTSKMSKMDDKKEARKSTSDDDAEGADETLKMEPDTSSAGVINRINDILRDGAGADTVPLTWKEMGDRLDDNDKLVLAQKFSAALEEMDKGILEVLIIIVICFFHQGTGTPTSARILSGKRAKTEGVIKLKASYDEEILRNLQRLKYLAVSGSGIKRINIQATYTSDFTNLTTRWQDGLNQRNIIQNDSYNP